MTELEHPDIALAVGMPGRIWTLDELRALTDAELLMLPLDQLRLWLMQSWPEANHRDLLRRVVQLQVKAQ